LEPVFLEDYELVDDLLTLAMFPRLAGCGFSRAASWQKIAKAPSARELISSMIARIAQSVTERDRLDLLRLWPARIGKKRLCAIDTSGGSSFEEDQPGMPRGGFEDGFPAPRAIVCAACSLSDHMPVCYKSFSSGLPDYRALGEIAADLDRAGLKNPVLATDRGFEGLGRLEGLISRGRPMIMGVKASLKEVQKAISELGEFRAKPERMDYDSGSGLRFSQFDVERFVKSDGEPMRLSANLKVNLCFDPMLRCEELSILLNDLERQEADLLDLAEEGEVLESFGDVRRRNRYCAIGRDWANRRIGG
jgi:hypothetical protein